jgi:hypothetical protein
VFDVRGVGAGRSLGVGIRVGFERGLEEPVGAGAVSEGVGAGVVSEIPSGEGIGAEALPELGGVDCENAEPASKSMQTKLVYFIKRLLKLRALLVPSI